MIEEYTKLHKRFMDLALKLTEENWELYWRPLLEIYKELCWYELTYYEEYGTYDMIRDNFESADDVMLIILDEKLRKQKS